MPSVDLTVCVEEGGRQRLALEVAMEGGMCYPARKFLQQKIKKINLTKKLEGRKKRNPASDQDCLEEVCWKCSSPADVRKLSQCADCRAAW